MKKCLILVLLILISAYCISQNLDIEDMTDEELEMEAQNDMIAFMQHTAPYRFSGDLDVGDKVEYLDKRNNEKYVLEVVKKENNYILIQESFEGNLVFQKIDSQSCELIDLWGNDGIGNSFHPELLTPQNTKKRMDYMINYMKHTDIDLKWESRNSIKTITIDNKQINCNYQIPDLSKYDLPTDVKADTEKQLKISFSEDVPCLLPFRFTIEELNDLDDYNNENGLVENRNIILDTFNN